MVHETIRKTKYFERSDTKQQPISLQQLRMRLQIQISFVNVADHRENADAELVVLFQEAVVGLRHVEHFPNQLHAQGVAQVEGRFVVVYQSHQTGGHDHTRGHPVAHDYIHRHLLSGRYGRMRKKKASVTDRIDRYYTPG